MTYTYMSSVCLAVEDLWECLGKVSGLPVDKVMSTWTKKMGYPVLDVQRRQVGGEGWGNTERAGLV